MQNDAAGKAPNLLEFKPKPAQLDFSSVKIEITCGMFLVLITCLASYWHSFRIGFLLDDYQQLDFAAKAAQGQWNALAQSFFSGSASDSLLHGFSPVSAVSFFLDYMLWQSHTFGYHITNILLFFGCCVLVSLITLELTGLSGNRLGASPAVWAGLLFAAYPLHPASVAWISGRVDLLGAVFYLGSLYMYLRFRLLKEPPYLTYSVLVFIFSLLSSEMAITLPLVLCLAEFCLWPVESSAGNANDKKESGNWFGESLSERFKFLFPFWLLLAAYISCRMFALGLPWAGVESGGGYPLWLESPLKDLNKTSKIVFPIYEQLKTPALVRPMLSGVYLFVLVLFSARVAWRSLVPSPLFFVCGWLILTVVESLSTIPEAVLAGGVVSNPLFFLPSAPLCILTALAALPAIDALTKRHVRVAGTAGALMLLVVFLTWSELLQVNLSPWRDTAKIREAARQQASGRVQEVAATSAYSYEVIKDGASGLLLSPQATVITRADRWNVLSSGAGFVEQHRDFLRVFPGSKGVTILLPPEEINPRECLSVFVDIRFPAARRDFGKKLNLVWQVKAAAPERAAGQIRTIKIDGDRSPFTVHVDESFFWRHSGTVSRLGVRIEGGDEGVDFYGIRIPPFQHSPVAQLRAPTASRKLQLSLRKRADNSELTLIGRPGP